MLASQEIPVSALSAHTSKNHTCVFQLSVVIKNTQQLTKIIKDIYRIPDVIEVSRMSQ